MSDNKEQVLDLISESLFEPHTIHQRELHQSLLMLLCVVNILTITVTFLAAPAL